MAVSSSLLPEPRVPLFPSHIHSLTMCLAPIIARRSAELPSFQILPSLICVSDPVLAPACLCLSQPQESALQAPYSSQSLSASPCPYISPVGPASPQMSIPSPHFCLSTLSPASEEHVWTRVPSEVRGEEKDVLGPAGW